MPFYLRPSIRRHTRQRESMSYHPRHAVARATINVKLSPHLQVKRLVFQWLGHILKIDTKEQEDFGI